MSSLDYIFWIGLAIVGLTGSALYSGLETGAYTLNRVRLEVQLHRGDRAADRLHRLIMQPTVLLSVLLIGNNVANYLGTAGLTVLLDELGLPDWQLILLNVFIVTPILFVAGETLPKDLFGTHSDRLMYRMSPVLEVSRFVFRFSGLLWLVSGFSTIATRMIDPGSEQAEMHPRRRVNAAVREGVGHGLLSEEQSALVQRVMSLSSRRVRDEMTPWAKVTTITTTDPPERVWELADSTSHSRFPVLDEAGRLVGVVYVLDALLCGREQMPAIAEVMREVPRLDVDTPLRDALADLQANRRALAVATERGKLVGLVTVKDLVETITGELAAW